MLGKKKRCAFFTPLGRADLVTLASFLNASLLQPSQLVPDFEKLEEFAASKDISFKDHNEWVGKKEIQNKLLDEIIKVPLI